MTAFQKLIEMPVTGRGDSYAPADFAAERVLPVHPSTVSAAPCLPRCRRRRDGRASSVSTTPTQFVSPALTSSPPVLRQICRVGPSWNVAPTLGRAGSR